MWVPTFFQKLKLTLQTYFQKLELTFLIPAGSPIPSVALYKLIWGSRWTWRCRSGRDSVLCFFPPTGAEERESGSGEEHKHTVVGQRFFFSDEWTNKFLSLGSGPHMAAASSCTFLYGTCEHCGTLDLIYMEEFLQSFVGQIASRHQSISQPLKGGRHSFFSSFLH